MRPRIALTLPRPDSVGKRAARKRYVDALEGAGAEVILIDPGVPLPDAFDGLCLSGGGDIVNSRHHQAVTDGELAPGLRASAYVDDLVEGLEAPGHCFVVGVQWHPERTAEVAPAATRLFTAFVEAAALIPTR